MTRRQIASEPFADRRHAGRALAARLEALDLDDPVVLALPRGGVPVAVEIARRLRAPLDLVIVRKIGVPFQPELAAAAVVDGGAPEIVVNARIMAAAGLAHGDVESLAEAELREIERRRRRYLAGRPREPLEGRTLVLVDDGIATGASIRAALAALQRKRPRRLILAVPVAPADVVRSLSREVDDIVCLLAPEDFAAVGQHYVDFRQVSDDEVISLLRALDRAARPSPAPEEG